MDKDRLAELIYRRSYGNEDKSWRRTQKIADIANWLEYREDDDIVEFLANKWRDEELEREAND